MDKNRKMTRNFEVPITSPRMVHDFVITKKYIMIPDHPIEFDPKRAVKENQFVFDYNKEAKTQYGLMPREDKDASNIVWFETEPHVVLHFCNGWDEVNAAGQNTVVLWACVHTEIEIGLSSEHFDQREVGISTQIEKMVFNMDTKTMTRDIIYKFKGEFPVIN